MAEQEIINNSQTPLVMANYYLQMFIEEMKKHEQQNKPKRRTKYQPLVDAALAKREAQRYKKTN